MDLARLGDLGDLGRGESARLDDALAAAKRATTECRASARDARSRADALHPTVERLEADLARRRGEAAALAARVDARARALAEKNAELGRARLEERARETDVSRRRAACAAVLERVNDALKEPRALLQEIDALREETADLAASEAAAAARGEPLPPSAAAAAADAKRRKDRVVAELRALTHGAAGAE